MRAPSRRNPDHSLGRLQWVENRHPTNVSCHSVLVRRPLRFVQARRTRLGEDTRSSCLAVEPTLSFAAKLWVEAPNEPSTGERNNSDGNDDRWVGFHAPVMPHASDGCNGSVVAVKGGKLPLSPPLHCLLLGQGSDVGRWDLWNSATIPITRSRSI